MMRNRSWTSSQMLDSVTEKLVAENRAELVRHVRLHKVASIMRRLQAHLKGVSGFVYEGPFFVIETIKIKSLKQRVTKIFNLKESKGLFEKIQFPNRQNLVQARLKVGSALCPTTFRRMFSVVWKIQKFSNSDHH